MAFKDHRKQLHRNAERARRELDAVDMVGDVPGIGSIYVSFYPPEDITYGAAGGVDAKDLALALQRRVKELTGIVNHIKKEFNEYSGTVTYKISGLQVPDASEEQVEGADVKMVPLLLKVNGGVPSLCKVERIEEEVTTPEQIIPAKTETVVRYRISNPEECGARG